MLFLDLENGVQLGSVPDQKVNYDQEKLRLNKRCVRYNQEGDRDRGLRSGVEMRPQKNETSACGQNSFEKEN